MEWITNYWYYIVLGLVAALYLFGYRTKKSTATGTDEDLRHESVACEKSHNGCNGCCQ